MLANTSIEINAEICTKNNNKKTFIDSQFKKKYKIKPKFINMLVLHNFIYVLILHTNKMVHTYKTKAFQKFAVFLLHGMEC